MAVACPLKIFGLSKLIPMLEIAIANPLPCNNCRTAGSDGVAGTFLYCPSQASRGAWGQLVYQFNYCKKALGDVGYVKWVTSWPARTSLDMLFC